ncbi:MAK10-like protein [Tanacetum coccineum]
MGGSYYPIPGSILSTEKNRKTPQRYLDVPTTSWRISIRSMDSFQGLTPKSPSSWHRSLASNPNFLRSWSRLTPILSSTHTPQAYVKAAYPNSRTQNEPPTLNAFAFHERTSLSPQPQVLGTTFEARVRDYMAAHTKRIERFENSIFKQREEINAKFPVTKNVNSISLANKDEERSNERKETPENTEESTETGTETPLTGVETKDEAENRPEKKSIKMHENDEVVGAPGSQPIAYYLKHKINEKLINGLVDNNRFNNSLSGTRVRKKKKKAYNILPGGPVYEAILKKKITKKEDIGGNFEIPCSESGCGSGRVESSTYMKLTDERPVETDIRLSLASHSYIYPLGIAEDVLVEVAEHVYPVNFVVMDIKENEKRHFILGMPFLTTAKASIKFDTGTITLRSGKSKISFNRIPEPLSYVEKGIKNDIEPIAPTMTVNGLVLEWEEKIRLHQEKKIEFNQWRSKNFKNKHPTLIGEEEGMEDEGEVTLYLMRRSLEVLRMLS